MEPSKQTIPFYFFLLALFAYPGLAARPGSPISAESLVSPKDARITQARAEAAARLTAPSDPLLHSQLELEKGRLAYEIALLDPGHRRREILVDANNGRILSDRLGREQ